MPRSRTIIHEGPWTQQEPASLWKSGQLLIPVTEKGDGGWSTGSCCPRISEHGRNLITLLSFLCLRARGCGDLWYFSGLNWKFNRTGRRWEWSTPASRNWQKNSPSSTTEASGCWPVFTISKRFAHTRSYINIKHTGLLTYSLCGQYLHLHPKRVSILTLETVWMLD